MQSFISFNRTFGKKTVDEKVEQQASGFGSLKTDDTSEEKVAHRNVGLSSSGDKSVTDESSPKNVEISSTSAENEETSSSKPINKGETKKDVTGVNSKEKIVDSESQEYIDIQSNAVIEVNSKVDDTISCVAKNIDHNPDIVEEMSEGVVTEDSDTDTINLNKLKDLFETSSDFTKQCFIMYLQSSHSELLTTPVDDMIVDSETVDNSDTEISDKGVEVKEEQIEDKEKNVSTDESKSSTDESESSTDESKSSTDELKSSTDELKSSADESESSTDESKSNTDESKSSTDVSKSDSVIEKSDTNDSNVDTGDVSTSEVTDTDGDSLKKVEQMIDPDELTLKDIFCQTPVFERRAFLDGLIEQITELTEYLSNFNIKVDSKIEILDKKKDELFDRVEFSTEEDSIKLVIDIKSLLKKRRELEELKKTVDKVVETYR